MAWIDPGEFGRGAAAREDARADRERGLLDELLGAGWNRQNAADARRLHQAVCEASSQGYTGRAPEPVNATALGLVGEARGAALAEWWAQVKDLDDGTRRMVMECAAAAAAMAMVDGYMLGRTAERASASPAARTAVAPAQARPAAPALDGARNATRAAVGVA